MNLAPVAHEPPPLYAIAGKFFLCPETGCLQGQAGLANGPFTLSVTVDGHNFPLGLMFENTEPVVKEGVVSFPHLTTRRKLPIDKKAEQLTNRAGPFTFEVCLMAGNIPLIQPISFELKTNIKQLPKEAQEWRSAATKTQRRVPRPIRRSVWETNPELKAILGGIRSSKRDRFKAEVWRSTDRQKRFSRLRGGRIGIGVEYRFTGEEPGLKKLKGQICKGVVCRWYEKETDVVDVRIENQGVTLEKHPIQDCSIIEWLTRRQITVPPYIR